MRTERSEARGRDRGSRSLRAALSESTTAVLDRWRVLRDRMLTDQRFVRWATGFPPFRPLARRRARALFDLCAGFVYTQVLTACVRLDLFAVLAEGPARSDDLASRLSVPPPSMARLLNAARSLGLVERRSGGRFGLGPLGAAVVGNPDVTAMVRHHQILYADLADPLALLRAAPFTDGPPDTGLARFWGYARAAAPDDLGGDRVAEYSALMAASQTLIAQAVLDAYPVRRHRCLMDVGGGEGVFAAAAAARAPALRLVLVDLPAVAARAQARFEAQGIADRADTVGLDFFKEPLPVGADAISLVRIIHDHDDDAALAILQAVRAALPPGGTLLLAEPMADTPGGEPIGGAYFEFYLLAMGSGRPRTPGELEALLDAAGFIGMRPVPTAMPLFARLMLAQTPIRPPI